jgi:hypothetical protein
MADRVDELLHITNDIGRGVVPLFEHNECYTSGAFDLLLVHAKGPEAFGLLGKLCDRYSDVEPTEQSLWAYFNLLAQLARQSNTTEMPNNLRQVMERHPALAGELRTWYRLEA